MALDTEAIAEDGASTPIGVVTDGPGRLTMTLFSEVSDTVGSLMRALGCT